MKVAGYVRVSTADQAEGFSLEAQEDQIRKWCEENSYELVKVYRDSTSGKLLEREALLQMLDDAEKGLFDVVVVTEADRISRDLDLKGWIKINLMHSGVDLIELNKREIQTPEDQFFNRLIEAFAEYETLRRQARIERGKLKAVRNGIPITRMPRGYRKKKDKVWIVEDEAEKIRQIFRDYLEIGSIRAVARKHNMPYSTVKKILRNPVYAGYFSHNGKLVKGSFEPIIPLDVFKRVNPGFVSNK
jgi:site-specific DNA recombinase